MYWRWDMSGARPMASLVNTDFLKIRNNQRFRYKDARLDLARP